MFNFKEFVVKSLIDGVKNGSFTKEYASILATNYVLKGLLTQEDVARFDEETSENSKEIENSSSIEEIPEEKAEPTIDEILSENTEEPLILE